VTKDKPLAGKRILVLEDDFYLADDEKALLVEAGAEVVGPFGSASQPGALAAIQRLDGAVVDINLGRGPDFSFATQAARAWRPFRLRHRI